MIINKIVCGIVFVISFFITYFLFTDMKKNDVWPDEEVIENNKHDWECNYIIIDCYTTEGKTISHYLDSYIENIDRSISFIGEDGLIVNIPYPYYRVESRNN